MTDGETVQAAHYVHNLYNQLSKPLQASSTPSLKTKGTTSKPLTKDVVSDTSAMITEEVIDEAK
jgi:hypothetical protein